MGYLCQEPSVFQRLTVEENILAILETHRYNSSDKYKRLIELLTEFNLKSLAKIRHLPFRAVKEDGSKSRGRSPAHPP